MKQIVVDNFSTDYYITAEGECYNSRTGKYLKGQINKKNGYKSFYITLPNGNRKRLYAHRLVALAFLDPIENKNEVNHIDGNKLNNSISNLEWVNSTENKNHAHNLGLYKHEHVYCFTSEKKLVAEYLSIAAAARAVNIGYSVIQQELHKEIKTLSGGFYWSNKPILGETKNYKKLGRARPINQYTHEGRYIMTYPSVSTAARALNCNFSHIAECCRGKIKTYKGFIFRYIEDIVSPLDESQSTPQE